MNETWYRLTTQAPGPVSPDEAGESGGEHSPHVAELPRLDQLDLGACPISSVPSRSEVWMDSRFEKHLKDA